MKNRYFYLLFKQSHPPTQFPWLIGETHITSDGPRTRFCNGRWATEEEARKEIAIKEKRTATVSENVK